MIENLTMGQLAADIGILLAICGGFGTLYVKLRSALIKAITDQLTPIKMEICKNFLVRCFADIDRGDALTETELERFKEEYDYYTTHGGNTYIKDKYEKLKNEGKL